jgi:hypothetical protein
VEQLIEYFDESDQKKSILEKIKRTKRKEDNSNEEEIPKYAANFFRQLYYLLKRTMMVYLKARISSFV